MGHDINIHQFVGLSFGKFKMTWALFYVSQQCLLVRILVAVSQIVNSDSDHLYRPVLIDSPDVMVVLEIIRIITTAADILEIPGYIPIRKPPDRNKLRTRLHSCTLVPRSLSVKLSQ